MTVLDNCCKRFKKKITLNLTFSKRIRTDSFQTSHKVQRELDLEVSDVYICTFVALLSIARIKPGQFSIRSLEIVRCITALVLSSVFIKNSHTVTVQQCTLFL